MARRETPSAGDDAADVIEEVFFLPPLAIARVGPGHAPMPSFSWGKDRTIHGAHRTCVEPAVTLDVQTDGSVFPYVPNVIRFSDEGGLRPVAPFFELWARVRRGKRVHEEPLTSALLERMGGSTASVRYAVTVANRKAQRRTLSASCAFIGRVEVAADDHAPREILAWSPHNPGEVPLVAKERPIPLGRVQAIRPVRPAGSDRDTPKPFGVDVDTLRLRFTPARGEVYGPPHAVAGPASPLPPGDGLPHATLGGRIHEIVPERNRILNQATPWSSYVNDGPQQQDPQPADSYDGANTGESISWGVVDDTCDGIIEAQVVIGGRRHLAHARVLSSCPDYAPDRRPFYSLSDDLDDRDLPPPQPGPDVTEAEAEDVADLFQRIFETAAMVNLDATRSHGIAENDDYSTKPQPDDQGGLPQTNALTMTSGDTPHARHTSTIKPPHEMTDIDGVHGESLIYAHHVGNAHARLSDIESLLDFLGADHAHLKRILRPPFGRLRELSSTPPERPNPAFRDPRVPRDTKQDMRMPPYMRDSDENPLSLTYRQYHLVLSVAERLAREQRLRSKSREHDARLTPAERRVRSEAERHRKGRADTGKEGKR
jgi:hypothetical protein